MQNLINSAFDSLAENISEQRQGPQPADDVQTFWTQTRPTRDMVVKQGAIVSASRNPQAPRFIAKGQTTLYAANAGAYYNNRTKRYEIRVQLVAEYAGAQGNLAAGDIDTVVAGATGFFTTNEVRSQNGRSTESNLSLAERCQSKYSSLDTGTVGGYEATAIKTVGLHNVRVVRAGDSYMMRDWDEVRKKHIGGKVDVWIKGVVERTITETFAFQFDVARRIRFT